MARGFLAWRGSVATIALLGVAAAQPTKNCFEKYQCIFHHDIGGQEYSWDLHQLCRENDDYSFDNGFGQQWLFNICGNASQTCAPGYPTYNTHGVAVLMFKDSFQPCNASSPKDCLDYDFNVPTCCTGQCYVMGIDFTQFSPLDENNLNLGVKIVHSGMPTNAQDPFRCPPSPTTLLDTERQTTFTIFCDESLNSTSFVVDSITENRSCIYNIIGRSGAACPVPNDPFECPSGSPSLSPSMSPSMSLTPSSSGSLYPRAAAQAPSVPPGYVSAGAAAGAAIATAIATGGLTLLISRYWWGRFSGIGSGKTASYTAIGAS